MFLRLGRVASQQFPLLTIFSEFVLIMSFFGANGPIPAILALQGNFSRYVVAGYFTSIIPTVNHKPKPSRLAYLVSPTRLGSFYSEISSPLLVVNFRHALFGNRPYWI